jgi:hypothetical protein
MKTDVRQNPMKPETRSLPLIPNSLTFVHLIVDRT